MFPVCLILSALIITVSAELPVQEYRTIIHSSFPIAAPLQVDSADGSRLVLPIVKPAPGAPIETNTKRRLRVIKINHKQTDSNTTQLVKQRSAQDFEQPSNVTGQQHLVNRTDKATKEIIDSRLSETFTKPPPKSNINYGLPTSHQVNSVLFHIPGLKYGAPKLDISNLSAARLAQLIAQKTTKPTSIEELLARGYILTDFYPLEFTTDDSDFKFPSGRFQLPPNNADAELRPPKLNFSQFRPEAQNKTDSSDLFGARFSLDQLGKTTNITRSVVKNKFLPHNDSTTFNLDREFVSRFLRPTFVLEPPQRSNTGREEFVSRQHNDANFRNHEEIAKTTKSVEKDSEKLIRNHDTSKDVVKSTEFESKFGGSTSNADDYAIYYRTPSASVQKVDEALSFRSKLKDFLSSSENHASKSESTIGITQFQPNLYLVQSNFKPSKDFGNHNSPIRAYDAPQIILPNKHLPFAYEIPAWIKKDSTLNTSPTSYEAPVFNIKPAEDFTVSNYNPLVRSYGAPQSGLANENYFHKIGHKQLPHIYGIPLVENTETVAATHSIRKDQSEASFYPIQNTGVHSLPISYANLKPSKDLNVPTHNIPTFAYGLPEVSNGHENYFHKIDSGHNVQLPLTYGIPVEEHNVSTEYVKSVSSSSHTIPFLAYGPPHEAKIDSVVKTIFGEYALPDANSKPALEYGTPNVHPPSSTYGSPEIDLRSLEYPAPSTVYGTPTPKPPSTTYGSPVVGIKKEHRPTLEYGVPKVKPPSVIYGSPQPSRFLDSGIRSPSQRLGQLKQKFDRRNYEFGVPVLKVPRTNPLSSYEVPVY